MLLSTAEGILFRSKMCFGSRMCCLIKTGSSGCTPSQFASKQSQVDLLKAKGYFRILVEESL